MLSSKETLDAMAMEFVRRRRHYSAELEQQAVRECMERGASVAQIAMAHGINALQRYQSNAPALGLPWQCVGEAGVITVVSINCGISR